MHLYFPSQSVWDICSPFKIVLLKGNKLNTEENAKVSNFPSFRRQSDNNFNAFLHLVSSELNSFQVNKSVCIIA